MPDACGGKSGWCKFCASIVQLGLTVAILVLVRYQLQGMATVMVNGALTYTNTCYLAIPDDWQGACTYADVAASVSMLVTFVTSVLQLYITSVTSRSSSSSSSSSCKKCPQRAQLAQVVLLLAALVWWIAAACTLQFFSSRANAADLPRALQRAIVTACCWVSVGLFALLAAAELFVRFWQSSPQPQLGVPVGYPATAPLPYVASPAAPSSSSQSQLDRSAGVVVGIPCIPAQVTAGAGPVVAAAPLRGMGAGAYQMALISGGTFGAMGNQLRHSLQPWSVTAQGSIRPAASGTLGALADAAAGQRVVVMNQVPP